METIGDRLRKLRIDKGLTLQEIEDKTHISKSCFSRYESGYRKPTTDNLNTLSLFFGVTMDYLLTGNKPEDNINDLGYNADRFIEALDKLDRLDMFVQLYNNPTLAHKLQILNDNITKCIQAYNEGLNSINKNIKGE